jgi:hypothetical protein
MKRTKLLTLSEVSSILRRKKIKPCYKTIEGGSIRLSNTYYLL